MGLRHQKTKSMGHLKIQNLTWNKIMTEFRIWDVENSRMISWEEICGDEIDPTWVWMVIIGSFGKSFILMSYIGIPDKNHNKIFEGDRIRYSYSDEYSSYTGETIVKWNKECAGFHPFVLNASSHAIMESVEIIGHKYEK